jgi:pimeloyl-ACP methyl ester carboxylesterase
VASFIDDVASKQHREILLVGESFGGLLAPSVAMRVNAKVKTRQGAMEGKTPIQGLVLVNPATSFDDTQWSTFAPLLWTLRHLEQEMDASEDQVVKKSTGRFPTPYSVIGGMALAATIPDAKQLQRIVTMFMDISVTNSEDVTEILGNMRDGFDVLGQELPPAVVEHRVGQWLPVGSAVVNKRLDKLEVPTLVIAGLDDNMLPTKKEAQRLSELMPNCQKLEIKGSGHFVLDERVNLTQLILDSDLNPLKLSSKLYDPIIDWKAPSAERIREAVEARVKPLRTLTSPVFYSTDKNGQRRMGLSNLPSSDDGPPLLFVANHQFGETFLYHPELHFLNQ